MMTFNETDRLVGDFQRRQVVPSVVGNATAGPRHLHAALGSDPVEAELAGREMARPLLGSGLAARVIRA